MRTVHVLFHVIGITPISGVKFVHNKGIPLSLRPRKMLAIDHYKVVIWM